MVGVTMKLWGGESDTGCCSVADVDDARRVADRLGIDHYVFNFGREFDEHVVGPYVADHAAGRTPNPCVECNRHLKFDALLRRAEPARLRRRRDRPPCPHRAEGRVARASISPRTRATCVGVIEHATGPHRFPIGALTKADVRRGPPRLGLRTAAKPDSQDVCFVRRAARAHASSATASRSRPGVGSSTRHGAPSVASTPSSW